MKYKTPKEMFNEIQQLDMPDGPGIEVHHVVPFYCEKVEKELDYAEKCHNLEEQLGCLLEVVAKALKDGLYALHPIKQKLCYIFLPNLYFAGGEFLIGCHSMEWNEEEKCCDAWDIKPADYKKTWWLKEDKSE